MSRRLLAIIALIGACIAAAHAQEAPPPITPAVQMAELCEGAASNQRYYPERARDRNLDGQATLDCVLDDENKLATCQVVDESPAGYGFGESALRLACRWTPRQQDIAASTPYPPGERHVRQTFRFSLADTPARIQERGSILN